MSTHTTPRPSAIVIGGGGGNGLGIVRNLGSQGIPVYCLTSDPQELTCVSRYCRGYAIIPDVEADPAILQAALTRFAPRITPPGVLFPTTDTAVLTLAQIRDDLTQYVTFIPPRDVAETMIIKARFYQSVQRYGIPHPQTWSLDEALASPNSIPYPVFIRPVQSLPFVQRFRRKGFFAVTPDEMQRYSSLAVKEGFDMMIQEIIPGPTTHGYVLRSYFDRLSRPVALFASKKLRQPSFFSNNCVKVSVPIADVHEFAQMLTRYLTTIGYQGLVGAEFKWDPQDGEFKLLEVNARSMGGNIFPFTCGLNLIYAAYLDALGQPVVLSQSYTTGLIGISLATDLAVLVGRGVAGKLSVHDLIPYFQRKKWSKFATDDVLPFFVDMKQRLLSPSMLKRALYPS